MSHPTSHDELERRSSQKSRSRRPFELSSPPQSEPPTPTEDDRPHSALQIPTSADGSSTPARTRSILNLTSSTLFGIYQPTGYATDREEPSTPWGTGSETPAIGTRQPSLDFSRANIPDSVFEKGQNGTRLRRKSAMPASRIPRKAKRSFLPLLGRNLALFAAGVMYGLLIRNLHDRQEIAPVKVELDRSSWMYLTIWGLAGAALGQALPWIDTLWASEDDDEAVEEHEEGHKVKKRSSQTGLEGWMDVIRSIGLFVGIAFAIRKLPWQSTLQLSLTLALSNPAVWYLIDRSPPGLVLSSAVAVSGTGLLLAINPTLVPSPSPAQMLKGGLARQGGNNSFAGNITANEDLVLGMFSQESVGVATWIASVLFVSSVCFGNIGRRLAT